MTIEEDSENATEQWKQGQKTQTKKDTKKTIWKCVLKQVLKKSSEFIHMDHVYWYSGLSCAQAPPVADCCISGHWIQNSQRVTLTKSLLEKFIIRL